MQTRATIPARKSFDNVGGNRVRSATKLPSELKTFGRRKMFICDAVQFDEQVVGALPRDKRVMAQVSHAQAHYNAHASPFCISYLPHPPPPARVITSTA